MNTTEPGYSLNDLCVELVIEPSRAGLTPEQVRAFDTGVMALYAQITTPAPGELA